ncbi:MULTISPECIES: SapC family protein [unclassified Campylobacter]|uniref:SapC family protein n=1 Tax=unclassified Campylobacter TaxID=2593542 RepID=UPI0012380329|nr:MULTISPECIES: SapC family protein [unclassified Campylobacter]KAA6225426.1 SapC family protein [Campylobacter sp. LR196d]KAA6229912.1 SapC family protein [Campylobacter sp. LR286c]
MPYIEVLVNHLLIRPKKIDINKINDKELKGDFFAGFFKINIKKFADTNGNEKLIAKIR